MTSSITVKTTHDRLSDMKEMLIILAYLTFYGIVFVVFLIPTLIRSTILWMYRKSKGGWMAWGD